MVHFAFTSLAGLLFIVTAASASLSMSFSTTHFFVHHRRKLAQPHTLLTKARRQRASPTSSMPRCTSLSSSTTGNTPSLIPRAAVSVVVRWFDSSIPTSSCPRWLLVQRGREPNKGMWSFPGGKIEAGEGTLDAAKRELFEETRLVAQSHPIIDEAATEAQSNYDLKWHNFGAFACSDSIHHPRQEGEGSCSTIGFHYVISQCFVEVIASSMPIITASDDASDARWWCAEEIQLAEESGKVTSGVWRVLERSEMLYSKGLLECD